MIPLRCWDGLWSTKRWDKVSSDTRLVLTDIFNEGQVTGMKMDPSRVSQMVRSAQLPDGSTRFSPNDWMTPKQIANLFSWLSSAAISQTAADNAESAEQNDALCMEAMRKSVYDEVDISLCAIDRTYLNKLSMIDLKSICGLFDVWISEELSKKKKATFVNAVFDFLKLCPCKNWKIMVINRWFCWWKRFEEVGMNYISPTLLLVLTVLPPWIKFP